MMQQNVPGHAYRPTAQQMSNLPIEDQLRARFANRGLEQTDRKAQRLP